MKFSSVQGSPSHRGELTPGTLKALLAGLSYDAQSYKVGELTPGTLKALLVSPVETVAYLL
jgi:hypothetical protein